MKILKINEAFLMRTNDLKSLVLSNPCCCPDKCKSGSESGGLGGGSVLLIM